MGYILKKGDGAGAGDATAANQVLQLAQDATEVTANEIKVQVTGTNNYLTDALSNSVFSGVGTQSVFKGTTNNSVFTDINSESVFKFPISGVAGDESAIIKPILNDTNKPFTVTSFTAASLAATTALLQTFLNTQDCIIVNISFSQSALSHDILLVYAT